MSNAVPLKTGQPFAFNTFSTEYPKAVVIEKGTIAGQEMHDVRGVKRKLWRLSSEVSFFKLV